MTSLGFTRNIWGQYLRLLKALLLYGSMAAQKMFDFVIKMLLSIGSLTVGPIKVLYQKFSRYLGQMELTLKKMF